MDNRDATRVAGDVRWGVSVSATSFNHVGTSCYLPRRRHVEYQVAFGKRCGTLINLMALAGDSCEGS